jgi:hypothetical protein
MCGYLPGHCTPTVIKGHIEFHSLARSQRRLTLNDLVGSQQEVVPMYKEVAVESGGVQEAPALRAAPDIATMALSQALMWSPAHHRLEHHRMSPAMVIRLHVELDRLTLMEWVIQELRHHALRAEHDFSWEKLACDEAPAIGNFVRHDIATEPLILEVQSLLGRGLLSSLFRRRWG